MTTTMTRWVPSSHADYDVLTGKDAYSFDGEKVGTIKAVFHPEGDFATSRGRHYFLLDPGLLKEWFGGFGDVYLPESAIEDVTADRVTIGFTKDEVKQQGWTTNPDAIARYRRA